MSTLQIEFVHEIVDRGLPNYDFLKTDLCSAVQLLAENNNLSRISQARIMDFKISPDVPRAPTTKIYLSMEDVSDNQLIFDLLAPIKFEYPRGVFHDMTARPLRKSYIRFKKKETLKSFKNRCQNKLKRMRTIRI